MTPSELKYNVQTNNTESHYFDRSSMKFFGDTMANYGVRSAEVVTNYDANGDWVGAEGGVTVQVWELYRKRAVKHGLKDSVYFDKATFVRVYPAK
ncbi:hypothetical protein VCM_00006 [Pseudomonas phage VCM]|uniref:Uncharacterized protein n=1 Tax=Pseudomonas phage VCM TaxID=1729937 RepID=A0A0S4KW13_9CAUD|nr:hypothetical protein VCM_00006 [Pseudomonas phage VCM]CUR44225.1 hypothetical protein VCM_00006 [Pseudomonas phage VCM]